MSQKLSMSKAAIKKWNTDNIRNCPYLYDLFNLPGSLTGKEALDLIQGTSYLQSQHAFYGNGQPIRDEWIAILMHNLNLKSLPEAQTLLYGYTNQRSNLRTFPTSDVATAADLDTSLDRFQETSLHPLQPLRIVHESLDSDWYYVITINYRGWIEKQHCDVVSEERYSFMFTPDRICYVTSDGVTTTWSQITLHFDMGAYIPVSEELPLTCIYPTTSRSMIPLPYHAPNILKLAKQCLGKSYDWGGKYGGRDCSSFVVDIFRCFGIQLPRNAGQQANCGFGMKTDFFPGAKEANHALLFDISAGACLFIPGHVMIYMGFINGKHLVIHNVKAYYTNEAGTLVAHPEAGVCITDLDICRADGVSYLSLLYAAIEFIRPAKA